MKVLGLRDFLLVSGSRDMKTAAIAATQRGRVARQQLLAAGISETAASRMLLSGKLHPVYAGVYAVGHPACVEFGQETAALLASPAGSVLSHTTAAALWNLMPSKGDMIDVTVIEGGWVRREGIRMHRSRTLLPRDVRIHKRLPVTSPARTLLDTAELLPFRQLERALDEALANRLVRPSQIDDVLARGNGRRGTGLLGALTSGRDGKPTITRSEAEERFLGLVRAAELPAPEINAQVVGYEVDFLWRDQGLVVEIDGYRYHSGRAIFERDRVKATKLSAAGLQVMRVTWARMRSASHAVVADVAQALARRSP